MDFGIFRIAEGGFAELVERLAVLSGLGEGHGEALPRFEVGGLLPDGGLQ